MKFRLGFLLALLPGFAFAQQGGVLQSGTVTPGHPAKWVFDNVIGDAGGAANGGLSELGITNTGTPFCINDAPITSLGGYHRLCLGANLTSIGGGALTYNAYDGAQPLPFKCVINGVTFDNCFQGGGVGPPGPPGPAASVTCPNITSFGGSGNGSTDNVPALAAALATQGRGNACVSFPPGQFKFLSTFSHTYSSAAYESITLQGSGDGVTEIIGPNNAGAFVLTLNGAYNSFHIRDMSIETPSACAGCIGLSVVQSAASLPNPAETALSDMTNVSLFGTDRTAVFPSGGTNYWGTAIKDTGVSYINFTNLYIQGILNASNPAPSPAKGVWITGDAARPPVVFNFSGVAINEYYYALYLDRYVQGVTWANGNMTDNFYGFYSVAQNADASAQLSITNSAANNCENIVITTQMSFVQVSNSILLSGQSPFPCGGLLTSIDLGPGGYYATIAGNTFGSPGSGSGTTAIHTATPNAVGGTFTGNLINAFTSGIVLDGGVGVGASGVIIANNNLTDNTTGISLGANVHGVRIANNLMHGNTTDLVNAATPIQVNYIDIPQDCTPISGILFGGAAVGVTYSAQYCQYYVHGTDATVDFDYQMSSKGSSTGTASLTVPAGISSASNNVGTASISFYANMSSVPAGIFGKIVSGQSGVGFVTPGPTTVASITDANFTNTSRISGQVRYLIPVGF